MGRSIDTIYNSIVEYKEGRQELDRLNSRSKTSVWRLWAFIMSVVIYTHELYFDLFKEEVEETLNTRIQGTASWYAQKALEYQINSDLSVISGTQLGYVNQDESLRLITRAAYTEDEEEGTLVLKLAKGDTSNLEKLTGVEIIGVKKYFEQLKFAGTKLLISSLDPDVIMPDIEIYHDGIFSESIIRERIVLAIEAYMQNLPFDAVFYLQKFVDILQAVNNVVDVKINSITIRSFENIVTPVDVVVDRKTTLVSGYLRESDDEDYNFDSLISISVE